jgi:hypothetical protein
MFKKLNILYFFKFVDIFPKVVDKFLFRLLEIYSLKQCLKHKLKDINIIW